MKKLNLICIALALLSGCTTNGVYDPVKTWTLVGALAVGAYVASESDSSTPAQECSTYIQTSGPNDISGSQVTVCR